MNTAVEIKNSVREKYAEIACKDKSANMASCCGSGAVSAEAYNIMTDDHTVLEGYYADADMGLGCGLPTQFANIKTGNTVLDLGSGAGNDCFVARARVGPEGRVIGVDFTPEMVEKARANNVKLGYDNVEFRPGDIEQLPLGPDEVDVVLSNCVLNLVPDKRKAFAETWRVLRPGGHFSISDVVLRGELPGKLRAAAELYVGCVSGAWQEADYLGIIHELGFQHVTVQKRKAIHIPDDILARYITAEEIAVFRAGGAGVFSITVSAYKGARPSDAPCCAPNAEGTAKVKVATGETCGCGIDSKCC
jgi:arsenite methyltransferase